MADLHRVTVLQTHPVQYMAPWFRYIAAHRPEIDLTVLYASAPMPDQQGVGFDEAFAWDVDLTRGYANRVLTPPRGGARFDADSYRGVDAADVAEAVAETRPDLVVVPGWHSIFYTRAIAACRRSGVPVVYRGDSSFLSAPTGVRRMAWRLLTRRRLTRFDAYLSVGSPIREYLQHFGAPEPLVFDSPHVVDSEYFQGAAAALDEAGGRDAVRSGLGAAPGDFLVLFAGKFIERKRPLDVITAAAAMGGGVVVAMAGNGPLAEAARAHAERIGARVTWCGFLNQSALRRALAAADCVAVPSRWESWGLIVNEALSAGTPCVVSTGVAAAADLIEAGVSGASYDGADTGRLAAALQEVRAAIGTGTITAGTCRSKVRGHSFEHATDGLVQAARRLRARRQARNAPGERRVLALCANMVMVFGMERNAFEVLRAVRERGGAVHCIVNRWDSSRIVDRVEQIGASWSTCYLWHTLRRRNLTATQVCALLWDVARTSVDVVADAVRFRATHVLAPDYLAVIRALPALLVLRCVGVPVIARLGNAPGQSRFYRRVWRYLVNPATDTIVCNSRFTQRALLAHGIRASKTTVIYPRLPARAPGASPDEPRSPRRVIFVGQLIPDKGVHVLLEAVGRLRARGVDVELDVVGGPGWEPPQWEGYYAGLVQRASAPDLAGRVRFRGHREDVGALMRASAVHCMCSQAPEGFGNVTLEAKAAGIPSVVTPAGGPQELVDHLVNGWVCRDASAAAVADGIEYFLADDARCRDAGRQAAMSMGRFPSEHFAREWDEVFRHQPRRPVEAVHVP